MHGCFQNLCIKNRITVKQKYEQVEYSEVLKKGGREDVGGCVVQQNEVHSFYNTVPLEARWGLEH